MNTEQIWDAALRKAPPIARKIAREYPGIDAEDIEQEIHLWVGVNMGTLTNGDSTETYLESVFGQAGRKYANRERYAYLHQSAEWIYTPKEISGLLEEAFFDPAHWEKTPVKDDGVTLSANGIVVSLWDIRSAFTDISQEDSDVIVKRFYHGDTLETSTERMRLSRAIERLTQRVNGRIPSRTQTSEFAADAA